MFLQIFLFFGTKTCQLLRLQEYKLEISDTSVCINPKDLSILSSISFVLPLIIVAILFPSAFLLISLLFSLKFQLPLSYLQIPFLPLLVLQVSPIYAWTAFTILLTSNFDIGLLPSQKNLVLLPSSTNRKCELFNF